MQPHSWNQLYTVPFRSYSSLYCLILPRYLGLQFSFPLSLSHSFHELSLSLSLSLPSSPTLFHSYLHSTQIPTPSHHRCHYTSWSKWADALPWLTYHRPYLRYPASQIPRSKTGTLPSTRPSVSGLNYLAANPMSRRPSTTV